MAKLFLNNGERKLMVKVREMVESTHWTRGSYEREDELVDGKMCYCLVGLVNHVTGGHSSQSGGTNVPTRKEALVRCLPRFFYGTAGFRRRAAARRNLLSALGYAIRATTPTTKAYRIESWNDRRVTTRDDVLKVIDTALQLEVK